MPTRVSVVVPVFNAAAYLAEAVTSVLNQTWTDLDVVVVDDGSTDGSADIARRFSPRVRLLRQPNRGIGAARNSGIVSQDTAFVGFLDADDLWCEGALETLVTALEQTPEAGFVSGRLRCFASPDMADEDHARVHVPAHDLPGAGMAGATLVRRRTFARVGLFDESLRVGEMVDWYLRARDAGVVEARVDGVVLLRRIHHNNQGRVHAASRGDYLRALRASVARRRGGPAG